ncbi:50S ribosomal protein L13 [Candidatus Woesebacteria bacterium RBG_16_36_11]|uniref:Large ribosomal subunit protein uL13 n=3 Tax=Candidatus Woeseibacteriota TaxID=1752722 RepID=A0A1F7XBG5_9BACT|nr:MAG: 50S ribosomal protein L13 [Candidatus Woesebacteria bacterium RBG_13_36_22]OGM12362.1 MAG: 50S ribosomal protein L13 [Candidatus Woesebacteria bacterium RBG_16_36_11]OGM17219.1 MAG: 50S ribosomal protein L13 [Candidatus Woesebacteria bacterium RBG_19FT_COMBO_37_29]
MKTYQPKAKEIKREWHLFDAEGEILGRLATKIAILLTGKNKAVYSTHMDMGDFVVVINAEKVELTGKKKLQKTYKSHSGYPGGFKEVTFLKMLKENPRRIIEKAVFGMLPDNRLKKQRLLRLKVYKGDIHPYKDKFKLEN